jgi:hypothetical protein
MKKSKVFVLTIMAVIALQREVAAQSWDAPMFFSPRSTDELGLYVTRTNRSFPGDATGLLGLWRQSGNVDLGVRAGVGDLDDAGGTVLVGAELSSSLNSLLPELGFDLAWNLGAGAVFGSNYTLFSVPVGLSAGVRLGAGSLQFLPYAHPRISFDIEAFDVDGEEETDTDGSVALDLGADINLGPSFILKVAGSLFDREAFGIGLALRWPRPVSVVR